MAAGKAEPDIRVPVFVEEHGVHLTPASGAGKSAILELVRRMLLRHSTSGALDRRVREDRLSARQVPGMSSS
jgi:ABC-type ATPase involved in cell division